MNEETMQQLSAFADVALAYGLEILAAIVILIVGWIVAGWADSAVRRALSRVQRLDQTLRSFLASAVRYAILVFVAIAALNRVGVQTASVIAVVGAAGLAVGLALQGTLQNVAAGLMLLLFRPFKVGDAIAAGGISGAVVEIGLFATEIKTADGVYLLAPNAELWNKPIVNFSRNPTRLVSVNVGIGYGDDVEGAIALARSTMAADPRVLKDPAPDAFVAKLADSAVEIAFRCWTAGGDWWAVTCDLHKEAKKRLEAAGYTIPFPQREVKIVGEGKK